MDIDTFQTPIGLLQLEVRGDFLRQLSFTEVPSDQQSGHPVIQKAKLQLKQYFEGSRSHFELPMRPEGSEFQQRVWNALLDIPYGSTLTYIELANKLGNPAAIRAVGSANGRNPLPILIPCHRVIGSDGKLVGYSGGIERKKWLLQHEGALLI